MTSIFVCMSLAVLMQGWDRPVIESSELAAPGVSQENTQTPSPPLSSEDLDSVTAPAPAPQKQEVKTRWEYDEEGKPVARVEGQEPQPASPPVAAPKEKPAATVDARQEKSASGRAATFWFLMPRR